MLKPRRAAVTQALSQCDGYLTRMGVVKEAVDDTAGAAKAIAQQQLRCVPLHACRGAALRRRRALRGSLLLSPQAATAQLLRALAPVSCTVCRRWTRAFKTTKTTSRA